MCVNFDLSLVVTGSSSCEMDGHRVSDPQTVYDKKRCVSMLLPYICVHHLQCMCTSSTMYLILQCTSSTMYVYLIYHIYVYLIYNIRVPHLPYDIICVHHLQYVYLIYNMCTSSTVCIYTVYVYIIYNVRAPHLHCMCTS